MQTENTVIDGILYALDGRHINKQLPLLGGSTVVTGRINYRDESKAEKIFAEIKARNITFNQARDNVHV